jgi:hypothetical protein
MPGMLLGRRVTVLSDRMVRRGTLGRRHGLPFRRRFGTLQLFRLRLGLRHLHARRVMVLGEGRRRSEDERQRARPHEELAFHYSSDRGRRRRTDGASPRQLMGVRVVLGCPGGRRLRVAMLQAFHLAVLALHLLTALFAVVLALLVL